MRRGRRRGDWARRARGHGGTSGRCVDGRGSRSNRTKAACCVKDALEGAGDVVKGRAAIAAARIDWVLVTTIGRVGVALAAKETDRVIETNYYPRSIRRAGQRGEKGCCSGFMSPRGLTAQWKGSHTACEARTGTCRVRERSVRAAPPVYHRIPLCVAGAAGETCLKGPAALTCGRAAAGVAGETV